MTVLVTGASGHVGNTLVRALLARGERVRVLGHAAMEPLRGLRLEAVWGDVRSPADVRAAMEGIEIVYHLAAVISIDGDRDGRVAAVNVGGTRNVAEAALDAGVRRMVHVSSVHAFDHAPYDEPLDETRRRVGPSHPAYDQSKAAGERALREVVARGLDAVIVNPSGVLGPNDWAPSQMGRGFLEFARRLHPLLPRGGFDWVDVRDVVAGILAAAQHGRTGENYILSGHWHSLMRIGELAGRVTGVPGPIAEIPLGLARRLAPPVAAVARTLGLRARLTPDTVHTLASNRCISSDKAARELGYSARPTQDTIRDTYAWFAANGRLQVLAPSVLASLATAGVEP